jgi:hypothetical protein
MNGNTNGGTTNKNKSGTREKIIKMRKWNTHGVPQTKNTPPSGIREKNPKNKKDKKHSPKRNPKTKNCGNKKNLKTYLNSLQPSNVVMGV